MPSDRIFRYVPLHEVTVYEAMGWVPVSALNDTRHGDFAQLMEYRGPEREHPMSPPNEES